jgi:hypothetical protein
VQLSGPELSSLETTQLLEQAEALIRTELAAVFQIPGRYLFGPDTRTFHLKITERDVKRFYTRHNAMLKGFRRRCRRTKALISKFAHKK